MVQALLTTSSITAACKKARVATRTYRAWAAGCPEFRDSISATGREAVRNAGIALQALCGRAVATLGRALKGKATPVEVKAAVAILDRAGQVATVEEMVTRIEALERAQPCRPAFTRSTNGSAR
jgi:hypothetical protein